MTETEWDGLPPEQFRDHDGIFYVFRKEDRAKQWPVILHWAANAHVTGEHPWSQGGLFCGGGGSPEAVAYECVYGGRVFLESEVTGMVRRGESP